MAAGWHSLPELNRAFAVGETAFLPLEEGNMTAGIKQPAFHKALKSA